MQINMEIPQKTENKSTIWPSYTIPGYLLNGFKVNILQYQYTVLVTILLLCWHHNQGNSNLGKKVFNSELAYSFRGFGHYDYGREHGSIQADVELEK